MGVVWGVFLQYNSIYFSLFLDEVSYATAVQFSIKQKLFLQVASIEKLLEV